MTDLLSNLANKYASDKGTIALVTKNGPRNNGPRLHITPIYSQYFEKIRLQSLNILEIGIGSGASLHMWYDYFPNSKIHAIDIDNYSYLNNEKTTTYIADQSDRNSLENFIKESNVEFDIIIDDGGHMMQQQQISFGFLFKYLKRGGQYWIEDLHTSFWPINGFKDLYGTALDINAERSNTTFKFVKELNETKISKSLFLTESENEYLTQHITESKIFNLPETIYGPNNIAFFKK